jgi:hypothetical protein
MVKERFYEMVDWNGMLCFGAWRWASRCVKCGNVIDDRINRIAPAALPSENNTFASMQAAARSRPFQMF